MCGIVGSVGNKQTIEVLVEGLKRLEYRGYDSAGIAFVEGGKVQTEKAVGKVASLEAKAYKKKHTTTVGIAHTRWATHGVPSEKNCHPHTDCSGQIAIVHNGIIENFEELRTALKKKKHTFRSDTDSEVIAHLIEEERKTTKTLEAAFQKAIEKLQGTYGIVAVSSEEPDMLLAARLGSPLLIGVGREGHYVASDAAALLAHTNRVVYLEDGEWAVVTSKGYSVKAGSRTKKRAPEKIDWSDEQAKKNGYPHFMLKEICEQPKSITDAIRGRTEKEKGIARLGGLRSVEKKLRGIERIIIVSCGTSYHAGLVGEYMIEEYAGIPVEVEYASEFRYRKPIIDKKTAVLAISQSGETIDTLAAIREAKAKGALTLGIVNVVGSTIARETDAGVYNHAGPEVSVASTKAFTSQLAILALLTVFLGRQREMSLVTGKRIIEELEALPKAVEKILKNQAAIKTIAKKVKNTKHYLYLGRKYNAPVAFEGALKMKEISYVSAEGYATGEMKHGPIALVDEEALSVIIAPEDSVYEKSKGGIQEIRARKGKVFALVTAGDKDIAKMAEYIFEIPKTLEMLTPLLTVIPLQLLAYHVSVLKGNDVDQPRNLAKSVTVE